MRIAWTRPLALDEAGFAPRQTVSPKGSGKVGSPFCLMVAALCSKEIAHYQRLNAAAKPPFGQVVFLDIVESEPVLEDLLDQVGVTKQDAMRRMHVVTEDARVVKNADAFREMWARLPYWRAIVPFCSIPGVMPAANYAYEIFAERRLQFRRSVRHGSLPHKGQ